MNVLVPESGLLFWMILSFGTVMFVLAKYGFPVILRMVDERKAFIEDSLLHAQKARDQIEQMKKISDEMLEKSRNEHSKIIQEAQQIREGILSDARIKAMKEAEKILKEGRFQLMKEKEEAMSDISKHIAELSLNVAEKVIRRELTDKDNQIELIHQLLDDVNKHQS